MRYPAQVRLVSRRWLGVARFWAATVAGWASVGAAPVETEIVYLSGRGPEDAVEWEFRISEGRRAGEWSRIRVPSVWEQEGYGTYNYGIRYYGKPHPPAIAREQGVYRHSFEVPADWQQKRVRLVFEGSMTDTHVRLNGISMGPAHQGGFYRFRHDVSQWLKYGGTNQLEITVDKESANTSVNMAERRADYWNFGGIFRPVFLEVLPAYFIDGVAIAAEADGTWQARVRLGDAIPADRHARVSAQIRDRDGQAVGEPFSANVRAGAGEVTLRTRINEPRTWTAETPELYEVQFTLEQDGEPQHVLTERFGFRTFEVLRGEGLFLNGKRILLKGINRHSFRPKTGRTLSREDNDADVRLIRELNMNAVRLSHYPPDPAFLEACDELGLYVINELAGWHGAYDTGVGRRLVASMVSRDVNHPSILFWSNGNEGGWNEALDEEFHRWDPSRRPVLHPQQEYGGVETMHYRSYGETQEYLRGGDIYLPTEFLHGLYDGGHGAGLWDYWEMMRQHPRSGGGFLWVLADEGIVRTDQGGRIDTAGNYGADGIVGPHHEKEGSFFAVREIWAPVQIQPLGREGAVASQGTLPSGFTGELRVENRFDFTDLQQCRFRWSLQRFAPPSQSSSDTQEVGGGEFRGPNVSPGATGRIQLPLPKDWAESDALAVTAYHPDGREIWTWSWPTRGVGEVQPAQPGQAKDGTVRIQEEPTRWLVQAGQLSLQFDKTTGHLSGVRRGEASLSFGNGPRFVAARRADRSLDGWIREQKVGDGMDRVYEAIADPGTLRSLEVRADGGQAMIEAMYDGLLQTTRWTVNADESVQLEYTYRYDGVVDLLGVAFSYPEDQMQGIRWLGRGPYRVWQNRRQGGRFGVWENAYNDPVPAETFVYPEFKGYFDGWRWAAFTTTEGRFMLRNQTPGSWLGVYTPRDGRDALLFTLPETGLAVLDVIPAIRNKVNATELVGPSSQPQRVSGERRGALIFHFDGR